MPNIRLIKHEVVRKCGSFELGFFGRQAIAFLRDGPGCVEVEAFPIAP